MTALKEEARDVLWKVGSSADPETLLKSVMPDLQDLGPRSEDTETRTQEEIWAQVRSRLLKAAYETRPYCIKCGECCIKGSPTLDVEDIRLFESGRLGPKDVYTVRKGEIVFDTVHEQSFVNDKERIKIRETPGEKSCIFFQKGNREDLVKEEQAQLAILETYLPKMMEKEEVKKIAEKKKEELSITDPTKKGMLMSALMKDLKGKADGMTVKEAVDSLF